MRSIGIWMLMLVVLVLMVTEADAKRTRSKTRTTFKSRVVFKQRTKTRTRGKRSIEERLTLPCEIGKLDSDKDGTISQKEWDVYIAELKPGLLNSPEYGDYSMQQFDVNGDGILLIEDFYVDTEYKRDCL